MASSITETLILTSRIVVIYICSGYTLAFPLWVALNAVRTLRAFFPHDIVEAFPRVPDQWTSIGALFRLSVFMSAFGICMEVIFLAIWFLSKALGLRRRQSREPGDQSYRLFFAYWWQACLLAINLVLPFPSPVRLPQAGDEESQADLKQP